MVVRREGAGGAGWSPAHEVCGLAAAAMDKSLVEALGAEVPVPEASKLFVLLFQTGEGKEFLFVVAVARILLDAEIVIAPVVSGEHELVCIAAHFKQHLRVAHRVTILLP